jgi:hypothetical protein
MEAVKNTQMALIIEKRTQVALQALTRQLSAAQLIRFKTEFAKIFASNIVIGDILEKSLISIYGVRDPSATAAGAYNVPDPQTDLESYEGIVMEDLYALATAIFVGRGSISELRDTLSQTRTDAGALWGNLQSLSGEGTKLTELVGQLRSTYSGVYNTVDIIGNDIESLIRIRDGIIYTIEHSAFLLDSDYNNYVAMKIYVDIQIGIQLANISGLSGYLSGINITGYLADIQRQKDLQAGKLAIYRDALNTSLTGLNGAQSVFNTAQREYGIASQSKTQYGTSLTTVFTATPTMSQLNVVRGPLPQVPSPAAGIVLSELSGKWPMLQSGLGTIYTLKNDIRTIEASIAAYNTTKNTTPFSSLLQNQADLKNAIQTLYLLQQLPSNTYVNSLATYLGQLDSYRRGLERIPPADRTQLNTADTNLQTIRDNIKKTESDRRGYVMNVSALTAKTSSITEKIFFTQSMVNRQTLAAKVAQLDLSTPLMPNTSRVLYVAREAARMEALLTSKRGDQVLNKGLRSDAVADLTHAVNAVGRYAKFSQASSLVYGADATAISTAMTAVQTFTGVSVANTDAQGAYTLLMERTYVMSVAGRQLAQRAALKTSLTGIKTIEDAGAALDRSVPLQPSMAMAGTLAADTGSVTTLLSDKQAALILNLATIRDSTVDLTVSQTVAAKLSYFLVAQATVEGSVAAVTTAMGSAQTFTGISVATTVAEGAYTVLVERIYVMTVAGRQLDWAVALNTSLTGIKTIEDAGAALDLSVPSQPSMTKAGTLAVETEGITTFLREDESRAFIIQVKIGQTYINLSIAGFAAGKQADFNLAGQMVQADMDSITVAQQNYSTGETALSDAVTAASSALAEMNRQYAAIGTTYIAISSVEGTIAYLENTVLPDTNAEISATFSMGDNLFTFMTTRRLFPQSRLTFAASRYDVSLFYINQIQIRQDIQDDRNTQSLNEVNARIASSISIITENNRQARVISATLDGLNTETMSYDVTYAGILTDILFTIDSQNNGLDTIQDSVDTLSTVTLAMNAASVQLSDAYATLSNAKQVLQGLINMSSALSGMRMQIISNNQWG